VVRGPVGSRSPEQPTRDHNTVGWAYTIASPPFVDRRRREAVTTRPHDFGHTLQLGEHFSFDLMFAGNPAGLAEASVVAIEGDPRGEPPAGAPVLRLEGHARTSGIVSLLATVTDDIVTRIDARSGATLSSQSTIRYSGWTAGPYRLRETEHSYEGRGFVRIVDVKDGKARKKARRVPTDTFDPLSAMAWVRSLSLEEGQRAKAHVIDGTTLLRFEIVSRGRQHFENMPSIGQALGLTSEDALLLEGELTRVDRFDQPMPERRTFSMRAWISADDRKIPLMMESDMWAGALRLVLTGYDPPRPQGGGRAATEQGPSEPGGPRSTSRPPGANGANSPATRPQSATSGP